MNSYMKTVTALHRTTGTNHILQLSSILVCISIAYLSTDEAFLNVEVDSPSAAKTDVAHANSEKAKVRACRGVCMKNLSSLWTPFQAFQGNLWGFHVYFPLHAMKQLMVKILNEPLKILIHKLGQRNWIYFNIHAPYHRKSKNNFLYYKPCWRNLIPRCCMLQDQTFKGAYLILELRLSVLQLIGKQNSPPLGKEK